MVIPEECNIVSALCEMFLPYAIASVVRVPNSSSGRPNAPVSIISSKERFVCKTCTVYKLLQVDIIIIIVIFIVIIIIKVVIVML
jgi:hypothetical protein